MGKTRTAMKIHWIGTVGGIVGYNRYGQMDWRSLAESIRNPQTEAQLEVRAKFAFISKFISAIAHGYQKGYAKFVGGGLGPRSLFSRNIYAEEAVTGDRNNGYTVNFNKVPLSAGNLVNPYNVLGLVTAAQQTFTLSWTDNTGVGNALATDTLTLLLFNLSKQESVFSDNGATRADETFDLSYPAAWAGDTAYIYAYFTGEDGNCSKSVCLGPYTL